MTDRAEPKTTVRVRVLVAVDHNGEWISHGHSSSTDQSFREWTWAEDIEPNDGTALYWIEADVPLPAERRQTIQGVVYDAKFEA